MKLSFNDIRNRLPHRFPIALVDRVLEIIPGQSLHAIKCITGNEPCFSGLKNGVPHAACAYPQTLMIESFLQAAGLFFVSSVELSANTENVVMLFGSLSNCVFHAGVYPGDVLEHHVSVERMLSDSAILTGYSTVDGRTVVEFGQAVVAIRPKQLLS